MTAATTFETAPAGRTATPPVRMTRTLALFAITAQVAFVISWIVAGALEPGYSHLERGVSGLAARDAEHAWIVTAGLVLLGLSLVAIGVAVRGVLLRGRAATIAAAGFVVGGIALTLSAGFPLDCYPAEGTVCEQRWRDGDLRWTHYAHDWLGLVSSLGILATPFAIARALWARPAAALAAGSGIVGIVLFGLSFVLWFATGAGDDLGGGWQRVQLLALHIWMLEVAIGVLYETRPAPKLPARATPLPPRDFFGGAWDGEGIATLWPAAIWRHLPIRFRAQRKATWIDDTTWTFDDTATFEHGWSEHRRRFCQFVTPERLRVTSDDLPNGAEAVLDDEGYRIAPFTILIPVGPVKVPLRVSESGRMEGDTFVETLTLRFLGLPAGTVTMRVRRTD